MASFPLSVTATYLSEIQENFLLNPSWIHEDNKQAYDVVVPNQTIQAAQGAGKKGLFVPKATRHVLGIVGGNEVSQIAGNRPDLESDLRGLTRPLTNCPEREWQPLKANQPMLVIQNRKTNLGIDIRLKHLQDAQMWAYPAAYAPLPLVKETCQAPHKY
jgi:hypothetical protein